MGLALLGVRFLLALVFVAAGIAKLRDRRGFARTLVAFHAPAWFVIAGATLIPLVELAVGLSFLTEQYATGGAVVSVVMLAIFTTAAGANLLQGRSPDCACFGTAASEPIGPATLIRNAWLIALALFVALEGPGGGFVSRGSWSAATRNEGILGAGLVLLVLTLAALDLRAGRLRAANARLTARTAALEGQRRAQAAAPLPDIGAGGLPVGTVAPAFDLPRLEGDRSSLAQLTGEGRPVALIFLSAHCPSCHELWPDIERWQTREARRLTVAAICSGSPQTLELKLMGHAVGNVLLEGDAQVAEAYALSLRPSAVIVGPSGTIASESAVGLAAIRALVAEQLRA
jgi:peroxiredoxin